MKPLRHLLALFTIAAAPLGAQTFSTNVTVTSSDTANPNLKVSGNGGALFNGTGSATGTIPATGAGTRLMWFPAKAAFLAGKVDGTQWDAIGLYAAALGENNKVPGIGNFAAGSGNDTGTGWCSTALGLNNAILESSTSMVIGQANYVYWGYNSFIAGGWNSATHQSSVAIGEANTTSGWAAATLGRGLTSASAACVVVGMSNIPIVGNAGQWVGADPVFIVGNGTYNTAAPGESGPVQSNALVVYKNGDIQIPKAQGDISMGEFGP